MNQLSQPEINSIFLRVTNSHWDRINCSGTSAALFDGSGQFFKGWLRKLEANT